MQPSEVVTSQDSLSTIDEIMVAFANASPGQLPVAAIEAARSHQEEITPRLSKLVAVAIDNVRSQVLPESDDYLIALYLLAEFKAAELWPLLMDLLQLPHDRAYDLMSDGIGEDVPGILAGLFSDDFESIGSLIRNPDVDPFVRWAVSGVYLYLVRDEKISREQAVNHLEGHVQWACDSRDSLAIPFATALTSMGVASSLPLIERAFELDLDYGHVSRIQLERESLEKGDEHFQECLERCKPSGVDDVVEELSGWAYYQDIDTDDDFEGDSFEEYESPSEFEPSPVFTISETPVSEVSDSSPLQEDMTIRNSVEKVGRNQPCPCNSGRKFKKCCGRAADR